MNEIQRQNRLCLNFTEGESHASRRANDTVNTFILENADRMVRHKHKRKCLVSLMSHPQTVPPPPHGYPHAASSNCCRSNDSSRPRGYLSSVSPARRLGRRDGEPSTHRGSGGRWRNCCWQFPPQEEVSAPDGLSSPSGRKLRQSWSSSSSSSSSIFSFSSSCRMKELPHSRRGGNVAQRQNKIFPVTTLTFKINLSDERDTRDIGNK